MPLALRPVLRASAATTLAAALAATTVLPAAASPVVPPVPPSVTDTAEGAAGQQAPAVASEVKGEDQQTLAVTGIDPEALTGTAGSEAEATTAPSAEPSTAPASGQPTPQAAGTRAARISLASVVSEKARQDAIPVPEEIAAKATAETDAQTVPEAGDLAETALPAEDTELVAALTAPAETIDFIVAGVTWDVQDAGQVTEVSVRVREDGAWTDWSSLEVHDGDERPGADRTGTEPLVTSGADAVQARVSTVDGEVPEGLQVDIINPGVAETDGKLNPASPAPAQLPQAEEPTAAPASAPSSGTAAFVPALHQQQGLLTGSAAARTVATNADVLKPAIVTRAQWGANESVVQDWGRPSTNLKALYIHHTAGSNNYTQAGAYAQIRGIFNYHAVSLQWGDIGYQFLVDKYGTIYQGRRGSIDAPVQGAQAGGFNTDTIGVSAMGNYDVVAAPAAMVTALERVLAWQAYRYDVDPMATTRLTQSGKGTARWSSGTTVTVPTILGHKVTNFTACPGRYLDARIPTIRQNVDARVTQAVRNHGATTQALGTPSRPADHYVLEGNGAVATGRWNAATGAEDYQIMYRAVPHGGGDITTQPWSAGKTGTETSTTLSNNPGETAQYAVRSRRGGDVSAQTYLGQHTGPVSWTDGSVRESGMARVDVSGGVEGKGYRSTRAGGILNISGASRADRLVLAANVGSGTVRVRVEQDGTYLGTLLFTAGQTKYRGIDLPGGGTGTVRLKVMDSVPITFTSAALTRPGQTSDAVALHRASCGPQFTDNRPGSGHFTAIQWMACEKISVGYSSDQTFRKNQDVTRGETAQFIYKLSAVTRRADGTAFKDVKTAYADAIDWFADREISVGYTDRTFRPNQSVSRGEFAAFLYRLADPTGYRAPAASPFKDMTPRSANYEAITWLRSQGVTSGYADSTFRQTQNISRAEAAAFLQSFYDGPLQSTVLRKIHG
ncbi:MAG: S-layer homology domain-containing protein [Micrococcus sp.]|nr:S-layer homology domain-containing protein [Micrococcus sp.]